MMAWAIRSKESGLGTAADVSIPQSVKRGHDHSKVRLEVFIVDVSESAARSI